MAKTFCVPSWFPPLSLLATVLISLAICLSAHSWGPLEIMGQAVLLIAGLRLFCYWPPFVQWVKSMPAPHRIVFALIVGGMIIGHYSFDARRFFPFVAWEIFPAVREEDPVSCREFIATTASGKKVRLLVEQLFPSIVQIFPLDDPKYFSAETLERLAHVLARTYNELHPADPVRHVDLMIMAVKLHPPANELRQQPSCELLKHYDVSSDR
jgi:hypothetical protein